MGDSRKRAFIEQLRQRLINAGMHGRSLEVIGDTAEQILEELMPTCLLKAQVDEPVFVLRAQDETFADTIRDWLRRNPDISFEKREAARHDIESGERWPIKKQAD